MPAWQEVFPIVIGLVLLGVLMGVRLAKWAVRRRGRFVARRGAQGELDGISLLEEAGFEVLDTQVRAVALVEIDGVETVFDLWLDAIATRDGMRYVAEFKTGAAATMRHAATRRQMLEYSLALPDHRLVLVDASAAQIVEIAFPRVRALPA